MLIAVIVQAMNHAPLEASSCEAFGVEFLQLATILGDSRQEGDVVFLVHFMLQVSPAPIIAKRDGLAYLRIVEHQ